MEVAPIRRGGLDEAVAVLAAAFWDYPETVHLLPVEGRRRRVLPRSLRAGCADSLVWDTLTGVTMDGGLVGVAAWLPPEGYPISARRQLAQVGHLLPSLPWGIGAAGEARRGQLRNRAEHPDEPHCFLRSIGVSPQHQGRGAGRAAVQPMLGHADRLRVGCYLTTAKLENVAFYERLGFNVRSVYRPTSTWPQTWSMWRPAHSPS